MNRDYGELFKSALQVLAILCLIALFSMVAARAIAKVLYQVSPSDPAVFLSTVGCLVVVVFLAVYFPARQASKVDPMVALRAE